MNGSLWTVSIVGHMLIPLCVSSVQFNVISKSFKILDSHCSCHTKCSTYGQDWNQALNIHDLWSLKWHYIKNQLTVLKILLHGLGNSSSLNLVTQMKITMTMKSHFPISTTPRTQSVLWANIVLDIVTNANLKSQHLWWYGVALVGSSFHCCKRAIQSV